MNWMGSKWNGVAIASAAGALPVAAVAGVVLESLAAAAFVIVACGAATFLICLSIRRHLQAAEALLRRPELRTSRTRSTGIFGGFLREAVSRIEHLEHDAEEATLCRTSLEAKNRVRQREVRQLEAALHTLDDPVFVTDTKDAIRFSNAAAKQLLAIDDSAENRQAPTLERFEDLKRLVAETRTRNEATDSRRAEIEFDTGNGEPAFYRATAVNIYGSTGSLEAVGVVLRDIARERGEKTRHAEFVSSVCHELKTPMAGIKAYVEMLLDGDVTEEQERQELYGFIDGQIDRLTRLSNNMLNLARIESGVIKIQREDCELNSVLHKSFEVIEPTAEDKQISITSEISELYMPVHLDPDILAQAIINLLSNAVKYTPSGGDIKLRSRLDETEAVIEVRDTGMGIPQESLSRIFDRFYRVPENNRAASGTGLGLSLVHYIITELCNGSISVASVRDEGTCFTLRIPLGHLDQHRKKQRESAACAR